MSLIVGSNENLIMNASVSMSFSVSLSSYMNRRVSNECMRFCDSMSKKINLIECLGDKINVDVYTS